MSIDSAVTIELDAARSVSGLLRAPSDATAGFVMAHGAGAGMTHPFMAAVADGLAARGIATLRYQFPYMQAGSKRPDRPALAHASVRAAVAAAHRLLPALPLFAGGKSFGARMTSQARAEAPLPGVRGLIFLGFPLHPAKQPSDGRAAHLAEVPIPMLFLQGTRDALADPGLLVPLTDRLGAALHLFDHADHSFHVPARSGRTDAQILEALCDAITEWIAAVLAPAGSPPRTGRP
jgi:predicted alpha/beta-hydrolase family hydrolase